MRQKGGKENESGSPARLPAWQSHLLHQLEGARRILFLGIGQPLKGDDAAGVIIARSIARRLRGVRTEGIEVIVAADTPESRTAEIRRFFPSHVLMIDAGTEGQVPGTIFFPDFRKMEPEEITTHRLPLPLLARYLEETVPCKVIIVAIEPTTFSAGRKLSPPVKKTAGRLARFLSDLVPEIIGGGL